MTIPAPIRPLLGLALLAAPPAAAQTADAPSAPASTPPTRDTTEQNARERNGIPPLSTLHTLPPPGDGFKPAPPTGPLRKVGTALADRGIYLRQLIVDEFAGNVTGGQGKGTGNSIATAFGGDVDLQKLVGLKGGVFHMTMNVSQGSSLATDHTGNAISFQTRYKAAQNLRLAALAYEQTLFDGKVNIAGGRVSPLSYFNSSTIYCTFQNNSVCFNPAVVPIQDRALGFFPYGTWGGRIRVAPSKRFYVQAGAFEANTALNTSNGFNFSTRGSTGVQTAVEIGFQSASPLAPNAYHLRLGGYRNSSPVADPFLNTKGQSRVAAGGTALMHDGQTGWYAMGDIVVARMGKARRRNVTLFGGLIGSVEDYTPFKSQAIAGVVATGLLASRPEDTLGFVGSYIRLGESQVDFLQASRAAAGGTDRVFASEGVFEVNYGFKAMRGVRISPNVQYVVNPDTLPRPRAVTRSRNILAFGLRLNVEMGAVLGLPVMQ